MASLMEDCWQFYFSGRAYIPVPSINQPQTSDNYNNSLTAISSIVANRHEELLNKRRQMVDHLKTVGETDIERSLLVVF